MNETSKLPFEPIPMPILPALPEMPKPSFSRSTLPPTPQPRPMPPMIVDDRPAPHPSWGMTADEFVPPAPVAAPEPTVPKSAGFPMGWLKPSRAKGVVLAGLGSLGIGAFGLNALVPMPVNDVPKAKGFGDTAALAPEIKKPAPGPTIKEERAEIELPGLLPTLDKAPPIDPLGRLPVPPQIKLASGTEPPAPLATAPAVPPAILPLSTEIPAITGMKDPLPVPALLTEPLPVPALLPTMTPTLPAVPLPGEGKLPMPKLDDKLNLPKPVLDSIPMTPLTEPKSDPVPMGLPAIFTPPILKPAEALPTPAPLPTPSPLPMTEPKGSIELKPQQPLEPVLKPIPLPVAVEAKTDYDVDIHKLRAGDTYAAISEKFYGSANFANALRGYNDNADLTNLRDVQVPPMHIIKKFGGAGTMVNTPKVIPAGVFQDPTPGLVAPPKIEGTVEWGSPGARKPTTPLKPGDETVNWK